MTHIEVRKMNWKMRRLHKASKIRSNLTPQRKCLLVRLQQQRGEEEPCFPDLKILPKNSNLFSQAKHQNNKIKPSKNLKTWLTLNALNIQAKGCFTRPHRLSKKLNLWEVILRLRKNIKLWSRSSWSKQAIPRFECQQIHTGLKRQTSLKTTTTKRLRTCWSQFMMLQSMKLRTLIAQKTMSYQLPSLIWYSKTEVIVNKAILCWWDQYPRVEITTYSSQHA